MSFIDGYRHRLVGYFGPIPVYRPLEDIDGLPQDFACPRGGLVIGGGSGEWPGLVLTDPAGAVAEFLWLTYPERAKEAGWADAVRQHLRSPHQCLDFTGWRVEDHVRFHRICTQAVPNPFDGERHEPGLESWLCCGLGELVFFAMPELAQALIGQLDEPHRDMHHVYWNNILLLPPGLPLYANEGSAWDMRLRPLD
jgi:hypothetical protein